MGCRWNRRRLESCALIPIFLSVFQETSGEICLQYNDKGNYCSNSQQHSVDSKLLENIFTIKRKFNLSERTCFSTSMLWSRVLSRHVHWGCCCRRRWRSQRPPELHTQSELELELTVKWQSHGAYGSTTSSGILWWRFLPSVVQNTWLTTKEHSSPIYDERQTQSENVLTKPWEAAGQDDYYDTPQPKCEFRVRFPFLWIKAEPGLS